MFLTRRHAIIGTVAAVGTAAATRAQQLVPTSSQDLGPFYPLVRPADHDADLTRVRGRSGVATGQPIQLLGRIVDARGRPVRGAMVDLWQCNAVGRYAHPGDRANPGALDPNFQGFARLTTDRGGNFRFRSIRPAAYDTPIGRRTPHIHFDISGGAERLVTQLYFPDEAGNDSDPLLKQANNRASLLAKAIDRLSADPAAQAFSWTIVLANA
jgi:protocatechuate 3,4-dioxygenase beta subunit